MIMISSRQRTIVKGQVFGARKDSCSCNPCDCNPCNCGDGLIPNYPDWRVSGYAIHSGTFHEQDLSGLVILALAQPEQEHAQEGWHEVLLVGQEASPEQIQALLALFEAELEGMPAEIEASPQVNRPVYRASLEYQVTESSPQLCAIFSPEQATLMREGTSQQKARAWTYEGPMALRGPLRKVLV